MDANFANIVGYQNEKVHTGVIRWFLDTRNKRVSLDQKYEALRRFYRMSKRTIDFQPDDLQTITCTPEYAIGRRRKIDLVVEIVLRNGNRKYLVMEMKVDSVPYKEQLEGTKNDFEEKTGAADADILYLLLLLGSAQVCVPKELHGFVVFPSLYVWEVFAGYAIVEPVYTQWLEVLEQEEWRKDSLYDNLDKAPRMWDEAYWNELGYRTWFALFYYLYADLRHFSKRSTEWGIYSGSNNPVLNWEPKCLQRTIAGRPVQFYWEFNYETFLLKVGLDERNKLSRKELDSLRDQVAHFCETVAIKAGQRTRSTYGTFNSLFKWEFDFKKENFAQIMLEVDHILDVIQPYLSSHNFQI